jgi:hypothetical protein
MHAGRGNNSLVDGRQWLIRMMFEFQGEGESNFLSNIGCFS